MNEPEILEAYRTLSAPVSAPPDVLERVERRITRRRRARHGVVAVAALAAVGGVGVTVLGGNDGDGTDRVANDPGGSETSTLTYTNTDGSTYTFAAEDIEVTCPAPGPDGRQHLVLSRPTQALPVLYVDVQVDEVTPGQVFDLPYDVDGGSEKLPMIFFFTTDGGDDSNELGSNMAGSTGTVTLHEATCGPTPSLWIEIDAVLGSEVEQPALAIEGSYHS